ncbi:MAG: RNA polymerase sigma-70 factor [Chitinophagaceae bacterium]|nr:RNA polymerase sigma-70 factor [Chitinophagaceae bacterium]
MLSPSEIRELQRRLAVYDDESAYKELFLVYYKPLQQFAFSFIKSQELAEEIVSDVFLKIWEKRAELEAIGNLKVYLYVSIKNTALKYLLKQKRQVAISLDELDIELESFHWTPEELILTAEMMKKIEEAINDLPPRCKIIFKLIKEDQLRYKEVAEILNVSVKTIDSQLAIALKKISKAIQLDLERVIRNN